jgi:anti-sigma factor RsiW
MTSDTDMSCRELVDFLLDYFEDSLPAEQRDTFDQHLALCPPCKSYLDTYRATIALGREACCDEADAVREEAPDELVQAILRARQE